MPRAAASFRVWNQLRHWARQCCVSDAARDLADAQAQGWCVDALTDYCGRCGASAGPGSATAEGCVFCRHERLGWRRLVRLGTYAPPLAQWVVQMKFHREWRYASLLAPLLAESMRQVQSTRPAVLIPVPMHWARRWKRGFNQALLLAQALHRELHWPFADVLGRTRYTVPQTTLTPSLRQRNVQASVQCAAVDLAAWDVWLIDDVKTTGSTLQQCARQLRDAGAQRIHVAVLAVADPHHQDFKVMPVGR